MATALAAPSISSVSPTAMPVSTSRQTLTINGSDFTSGATLTFDPPTGSNINSNSSYLTFVSSNQIRYEVNNAGDVGVWQVKVNNPDSQSSRYVPFTVTASTPAPSISSVSPTTMPGSTSRQTLTINGSNFTSGATLTFDPPTGSNISSNSLYLTFVSSNQIRYEVKNAGDVGVWQVKVNNPDGQSSGYAAFTVTASAPAPSISSVSPTTMPGSTSRQTLTINGSNFTSGATLTFDPPTGSNINSNSLYLTFVSSNQIRYEINNAGDVGVWQVKVNNPDGQSSGYAAFTITRAPSSVANLSALTLSAGTINPDFATNATSYTLAVANGVSSTTVTPTASQVGATVKVNGTLVVSGTASTSIPLVVGANTIKVLVTAQNGTTKTYTVTVTRKPSSNAWLKKLVVKDGSLSPKFAQKRLSYKATVPTSRKSIRIAATAAHPKAKIKIAGMNVASATMSKPIALNPTRTTIKIVVTAQDGTTEIYEVTATRP